jgi:hypothetical protein
MKTLATTLLLASVILSATAQQQNYAILYSIAGQHYFAVNHTSEHHDANLWLYTQPTGHSVAYRMYYESNLADGILLADAIPTSSFACFPTGTNSRGVVGQGHTLPLQNTLTCSALSTIDDANFALSATLSADDMWQIVYSVTIGTGAVVERQFPLSTQLQDYTIALAKDERLVSAKAVCAKYGQAKNIPVIRNSALDRLWYSNNYLYTQNTSSGVYDIEIYSLAGAHLSSLHFAQGTQKQVLNLACGIYVARNMQQGTSIEFQVR